MAAKPAFFRYNENFTLVRDFYVAYFVIPEIRDELLKRVSATVSKAGIITRLIQVSTMANSFQQKFSKKMQSYKQIVV